MLSVVFFAEILNDTLGTWAGNGACKDTDIAALFEGCHYLVVKAFPIGGFAVNHWVGKPAEIIKAQNCTLAYRANATFREIRLVIAFYFDRAAFTGFNEYRTARIATVAGSSVIIRYARLYFYWFCNVRNYIFNWALRTGSQRSR